MYPPGHGIVITTPSLIVAVPILKIRYATMYPVCAPCHKIRNIAIPEPGKRQP